VKPESTFRPEAIEHHRRGLGPGELIRLSPVWTTWAFVALLALFAGLIATSMLVTLEERAEAPAVLDIDERVAIALFPASYAGDIEVGDEMTLLHSGGSRLALTVSSIGDVLLPSSSEAQSPVGAASASAQSQSVIPVHAPIPDGLTIANDVELRAVVRFEETLLSTVLPALGDLFGGPGG
jgi:hypothetical protein